MNQIRNFFKRDEKELNHENAKEAAGQAISLTYEEEKGEVGATEHCAGERVDGEVEESLTGGIPDSSNGGIPDSSNGGCGGEVMAGLLIRRYQDVLMDRLDEAVKWLGDDWKDKRVNRASGLEEDFVPVLDDLYRLARLMRLDADKLIHGKGRMK